MANDTGSYYIRNKRTGELTLVTDGADPQVAIRREQQKTPNSLVTQEGPLSALADLGNQLDSGAGQVVSGIGSLIRPVPLVGDAVGGGLEDWGRSITDRARARYSPERLEESQSGKTTLMNTIGGLVESAPSMVPAVGAGILTANPAMTGAVEATLATGQTADQIKTTLREMAINDPDGFIALPVVQEALTKSGGNLEKALKLVGDHVSGIPSIASGIATAMASTATGGLGSLAAKQAAKNVILKALTGNIAGRVVGTAIKEAGEEALQSPAQQLAANIGVKRADPAQDLMEGVPESAQQGALLGGIGGGLFGLGEGAANARQQNYQKRQAARAAIMDPAEEAFLAAHEKAGMLQRRPDDLAPIGAPVAEPEQDAAEAGLPSSFIERGKVPDLPEDQRQALAAAITELDGVTDPTSNRGREATDKALQDIQAVLKDHLSVEDLTELGKNGHLPQVAEEILSLQKANVKLTPDQNDKLTNALSLWGKWYNQDGGEDEYNAATDALSEVLDERFYQVADNSDDLWTIARDIWRQNNSGKTLPGEENEEQTSEPANAAPSENVAPEPEPQAAPVAGAGEPPAPVGGEGSGGDNQEPVRAAPPIGTPDGAEPEGQAAPELSALKPATDLGKPIPSPRPGTSERKAAAAINANKAFTQEEVIPLSKAQEELASDVMAYALEIKGGRITRKANTKLDPEAVSVVKMGKRAQVNIPVDATGGDRARALALARSAEKSGMTVKVVDNQSTKAPAPKAETAAPPAAPKTEAPAQTPPEAAQQPSGAYANASSLKAHLRELNSLQDDAYEEAVAASSNNVTPREVSMLKAAALNGTAVEKEVISDLLSATRKKTKELATASQPAPSASQETRRGDGPEKPVRVKAKLDIKQSDSREAQITKYIDYLDSKPRPDDAADHAERLRDLVNKREELNGNPKPFPLSRKYGVGETISKARLSMTQLASAELVENKINREADAREQVRKDAAEKKAREAEVVSLAKRGALARGQDKTSLAEQTAKVKEVKPNVQEDEPVSAPAISEPEAAAEDQKPSKRVEKRPEPEAEAAAAPAKAEEVVATEEVASSRDSATEERAKAEASDDDEEITQPKDFEPELNPQEPVDGRDYADTKNWSAKDWADELKDIGTDKVAFENAMKKIIPLPAADVKTIAKEWVGSTDKTKKDAITSIRGRFTRALFDETAVKEIKERSIPVAPRREEGAKPTGKHLNELLERPSNITISDWELANVAYQKHGELGIADEVSKLIKESMDTEKYSKPFRKMLAHRAETFNAILETLNSRFNMRFMADGVSPASSIVIQDGAIPPEKLATLQRAIQEQFEGRGLSDIKVALVRKIVDVRTKEPIAGDPKAVAFHRLVVLATGNIDPNLSVDEMVSIAVDRMDHEMVHSMLNLGLIRKGEWANLVKAVSGKGGELEAINAIPLYKALSLRAREEEAVAEAYRKWMGATGQNRDNVERNPNSTLKLGVRSIFQRITAFLKSLTGGLKKAKVNDAQGLYGKQAEVMFERIRNGTVGRRRRDLQPNRNIPNYEPGKSRRQVMRIEHIGRKPFDVILNPNKGDLNRLSRQKDDEYGPYKGDGDLRYIKLKNGDTFVFNGGMAIHDQVERALIGQGFNIPDPDSWKWEETINGLATERGYIYEKGGEFKVDPYGSYQLPKYMYGGSTAETANLSNLERARTRLAMGESSRTVRQETGWFRGLDHVMRFEIGDSTAFVKPDWARYKDAVAGIQLSEILDHPALYRAYPQLKNVKVYFADTNARASWVPDENAIILNNNLIGDAKTMKSSILHETQHAIQQIEGMATGMSAREFLPPNFNPVRDQLRARAWKFVASTKGATIGMFDDALLQQAFQRSPAFRTEVEAATRIYKDWPAKERDYLLNTMVTKTQESFEFAEQVGKMANDRYKRSFGEIEARDVQARMDMNRAEREAIAPYSSQNEWLERAVVDKKPSKMAMEMGDDPKWSVSGLPSMQPTWSAPEADESWLYSPTYEVAKRFPQESSTRIHMAKWVERQSPKDELKNLDLDEWVKQSPKATKKELLAYLKQKTNEAAPKVVVIRPFTPETKDKGPGENMYKTYTMRGDASPNYRVISVDMGDAIPVSNAHKHLGGEKSIVSVMMSDIPHDASLIAQKNINIVAIQRKIQKMEDDLIYYNIEKNRTTGIRQSPSEFRDIEGKIFQRKADIKALKNELAESNKAVSKPSETDLYIDQFQSDEHDLGEGDKRVSHKEVTKNHVTREALMEEVGEFNQKYKARGYKLYPTSMSATKSYDYGVMTVGHPSEWRELSELPADIADHAKRIMDSEPKDFPYGQRWTETPYQSTSYKIAMRAALMQAIKEGYAGFSWNTGEGVNSIPGHQYEGTMYDKAVPEFFQSLLKPFKGTKIERVDFVEKSHRKSEFDDGPEADYAYNAGKAATLAWDEVSKPLTITWYNFLETNSMEDATGYIDDPDIWSHVQETASDLSTPEAVRQSVIKAVGEKFDYAIEMIEDYHFNDDAINENQDKIDDLQRKLADPDEDWSPAAIDNMQGYIADYEEENRDYRDAEKMRPEQIAALKKAHQLAIKKIEAMPLPSADSSAGMIKRWRFNITPEMRAHFAMKGQPRYMASYPNQPGTASHPVYPGQLRTPPKKAAKPLRSATNTAELNSALFQRRTIDDLTHSRDIIDGLDPRQFSKRSIATRWWMALDDLPAQQYYLILRKLTAGTKSIADDHFRAIMNTMQSATKSDQDEIRRYLITRGADPALISDPEARKAAVEAKTLFTKMGAELVRRGLIRKEQYALYKDRYLPRMFMEYAEKQLRTVGIKMSPMSYGQSRAQTSIEKARGGLNMFLNKEPGLVRGVSTAGFDFENWNASMLPALEQWGKEVRKNIRGARKNDLMALAASGLPQDKLDKAIRSTNRRYAILSQRTRRMEKLAGMNHADEAETAIASDARKGLITDPGFLSFAGLSVEAHDIIMGQHLNNIATAPTFLGQPDLGWVWPDTLLKYRGQNYSPYGLLDEFLMTKRNADRTTDPLLKAAALKELQDIQTILQPHLVQMGTGAFQIRPPDLSKGKGSRYKQLPESAAHGDLRGLVVHKSIYNDIMGSMRPVDLNENAIKKFAEEWGGKMFSLFKQTKTTLNPQSHFRQFFQNIVMLHLSGMNYGQIMARLVQAAKIRLDVASGKTHPIWTEAKRYGIREGSFTNVEARRALNVLQKLKEEQLKLKVGNNPLAALSYAGKAARMMGEAFDKAGDLYQFNDTLFRLAKVLHEHQPDAWSRALGKKPAKIGDALLEADEWFFDYSLVPGAVRWLRNSVMPFATFSYKALPKLMDVATDVKNGGATRFLPYVALTYGLMAAFQGAMQDMTDEEAKAAKKAMTEQLRKNAMIFPLPFRDDQGRFNFVDLGSFNPWNSYWQSMNAMGRVGDEGPTALLDAAKAAGFGNPALDFYTGLETGLDPFTGRPIFDPEMDTPAEQMMAFSSWALNIMLPPFFTQYGVLPKAMDKLYGNDVNETTGKTYESWPDLSMRMVGFNTYALDAPTQVETNLRSISFEEQKAKEAAGATSRRLERQIDAIDNNPSLSDARKESAIASLNAQIDETYRRLDQKLDKLYEKYNQYQMETDPIIDYTDRHPVE